MRSVETLGAIRAEHSQAETCATHLPFEARDVVDTCFSLHRSCRLSHEKSELLTNWICFWNGDADIHFFQVHDEELKDERHDDISHKTQRLLRMPCPSLSKVLKTGSKTHGM